MKVLPQLLSGAELDPDRSAEIFMVNSSEEIAAGTMHLFSSFSIRFFSSRF
jgi:hypothetical protein